MKARDWQYAKNPAEMLRWVDPGPGIDRKLRLFAVACCRQIWDVLPPVAREGVAVAESFADGSATEQERLDAIDRLRSEPGPVGMAVTDALLTEREEWSALDAAVMASTLVGHVTTSRDPGEWMKASRTRHAGFLRDILGNPFRRITFDPGWRTDTAVSLARQMYESRDFAALPILADALQDAGCEHADVLGHCRDPHLTHVRGCWVVDLVLGKA